MFVEITNYFSDLEGNFINIVMQTRECCALLSIFWIMGQKSCQSGPNIVPSVSVL